MLRTTRWICIFIDDTSLNAAIITFSINGIHMCLLLPSYLYMRYMFNNKRKKQYLDLFQLSPNVSVCVLFYHQLRRFERKMISSSFFCRSQICCLVTLVMFVSIYMWKWTTSFICLVSLFRLVLYLTCGYKFYACQRLSNCQASQWFPYTCFLD